MYNIASLYRSYSDICQRVLTAAARREGGPSMYYASAYARAVIYPHEIPTQALYLLHNLQHWRGEEARAVKQELKRIAHAKELSE